MIKPPTFCFYACLKVDFVRQEPEKSPFYTCFGWYFDFSYKSCETCGWYLYILLIATFSRLFEQILNIVGSVTATGEPILLD